MEPIERVSHPSMAQIEALLQYLEEKPHLAKGFLRNQSAKAQAHREWEQITAKLNSIGGGSIKTAKKWMKYWADKKSAVKKKAAARAVARRRTGGGIEDVPDLTEIEERIVALMGGGGFATGDVHLQLQVFDEPTPSLNNSPSILVYSGQNIATNQVGPSTPLEFNLEPPHSMSLFRELPDQSQNQPHHLPTAALQAPTTREMSPMAATSSHRPATPAGDRDNSPQLINPSAVSTPRRRRIRRRSPPSQRRSQFNSTAEKFLRLEEQRLALERRLVTVLEQNVEMGRSTAQANLALGEGLKALGEGLTALSESLRRN